MIVLPFILIIISAFLTRHITKSWLSPGSFFSISWSFFLIVPLIFASEYKTDILGLWFIAIFTMAIVSGSLVANASFIKRSNRINNLLIVGDYKILNFIFLLFTIISFIGLCLLLQFAANIYSSDYYNTNWLSIPNFIAIDRYGNDINYPYLIISWIYYKWQ